MGYLCAELARSESAPFLLDSRGDELIELEDSKPLMKETPWSFVIFGKVISS